MYGCKKERQTKIGNTDWRYQHESSTELCIYDKYNLAPKSENELA